MNKMAASPSGTGVFLHSGVIHVNNACEYRTREALSGTALEFASAIFPHSITLKLHGEDLGMHLAVEYVDVDISSEMEGFVRR